MRTKLMMLVLLFAVHAHGSFFYIVGDTFLGKYTEGREPEYLMGVLANSSSFDPERCRLWLTEGDWQLKFLEKQSGLQRIEGTTVQLLSEVREGNFVTRSQDGNFLQLRDNDGRLKTQKALDWAKYTQQIELVGNQLWALNAFETERRVWMTHLDGSLKETKTTEIRSGNTVWPNFRIMADSVGKSLWIGLSTATAQYSYVPHVQRRSYEGELLNTVQWREKGLFFAFGLDAPNKMFVARDNPSTSGFTVPVYSYLERLESSGLTSTAYEAELNFLIDAMVADQNAVYMIQRAIMGSDTYLVKWDKKEKTSGERLFKLPSKANALYQCH